MPRTSSHVTAFVLKVAAILGMTANHVANVIGPAMPWQVTVALYSFGGITYPIMAFLLIEGYRYTSNLRKYALRLFLFALASQAPFTLCFGWGPYPIPRLNVLFTLLIGLGILWAHDHARNQGVFFLAFVGGVAASAFCDWALSGPVVVLLFYMLRGKGRLGIVLSMAFLYAYLLLPQALDVADLVQRGMVSAQNAADQGIDLGSHLLYFAGTPVHMHSMLISCVAKIGYALVGFTLATVLLCQYNGLRGRPMKWFFYAYYPLHLLVIWAVGEVLTRL